MLNNTISKVSTFALLGAAAAFAAAGTYKVDILDNTSVEGKQVKAGTYKVEVENNTAMLKHGKDVISVPAHTEQAASKYSGTQIQYVDNSIKEIHVGGTTTKIVFDSGNATPGSGSD